MERTPEARDSHFTGRLESFGDVVFGFSISQLALHLDPPRDAAAIVGHPIKWVLYFGTFALIAGLWMQYHRALGTGFRPQRLEVAAVFVFLAFVGLMPYAMFANVSLGRTTHDAQVGLGTYLACSVPIFGCLAFLTLRSARRAWNRLDAAARLRSWRIGVMYAGMTIFMLILLLLDITAGAVVAGPMMILVPVLVAVARRRAPMPGSLARIPAVP